MFKQARFKLTAWYLAIIMMVSLTFSVIIYQMIASEVDRFDQVQRERIERRLIDERFFPQNLSCQPPMTVLVNPELLEETKHRFLLMLIGINGSIFFIAGGLGYVLAGRTLNPIQVMLEEQNRFISDASHELKTPLTSLKSSFEVYLRDNNRNLKDADLIVKDSIEDVNKLQFLSESLLKLARYQNDNNHRFFEKLNVSELIIDSIKKINAMAKKKEIKIQYPKKNLEISGEKENLVNLLVILLDNAIKYSSEKSEIKISTKKVDHSVIISVTDFGFGIEEKDLPFIFDRFYRSDTARVKSDQGGYGLGLAIAKQIVESHQGSISVESKINKGSTFIVKLPTNLPQK